jgi:RimJ/RimL family protein N-acetyltransferase
MLRKIKIVFNQFKELSFKQFLMLIFQNLYQNDSMLIYVYDLKEAQTTSNAPLENFVIQKGEISELEKLGKQFDPIPWELKCNEYDGVEDFFIVRNGDSLQHINWIYYSHHHNRNLILGKKEAEFKFGLTFPQYRGRGLQPLVLDAMAQYLQKKGFQRVFACVLPENKPSIRGIEKAGFKRVGKTRLRKILGVRISKKINTSEI